MDIKIQGITKEIMNVALMQAREGRMHILGIMRQTLETPRAELSAYAPRMITIKIKPEKIRDVIGKGGAVIRAITEETGTTIDINDDGTVTIACVSSEGGVAAKRRIEEITAEVEVGRIYDGTVLKLLDFGAIVSVLPGKDGLLHISQIANERVKSVADHLKEGQAVRVKVLEADEKGRLRLVDESGRGRTKSRELKSFGGAKKSPPLAVGFLLAVLSGCVIGVRGMTCMQRERVDVGLQHHQAAHQHREHDAVEEHIAQDVAFVAVPAGRGGGHDDGLRVDHLAHHAARTVGRCHQIRVQAELLGRDLLQSAKQHVGCRIGPVKATPSQPSMRSEERIERAGVGECQAHALHPFRNSAW